MKKTISYLLSAIILLSVCFVSTDTVQAENNPSGTVKMIRKEYSYEAFGSPRPGPGMKNVPLGTSFFIRLYVEGDRSDRVDPDSVELYLKKMGAETGSEDLYIVRKGQKYEKGYTGEMKFNNVMEYGTVLEIYIDSTVDLEPRRDYIVNLSAESEKGSKLYSKDAIWVFSTESHEDSYKIEYSLDLKSDSYVEWQGQFFSGVVQPCFATLEAYGTERFDYMFRDEIKKEYPKAWNLFRDFRLSGSDYYDMNMLPSYQPNIVREMETRHIKSIKETDKGILLYVEDFFGHEQYGIESNRPVSEDYKPGDEIMIADGVNNRRAFVIEANDADSTVLVTKFSTPPGGWRLNYLQPLPRTEEAGRPGLFPKGGAYLYKFNPVGTPVYYWGRLDYIWDKLHKEYGLRLAPGFAEAPGDLSIDGVDWTTAKDYVQLHKVTYDITTHLIERYGDATLDWVWSVFNEPDLSFTFWRCGDWTELQKFYDYSVDAILKAFEDKGYDSDKVFIGGLELGGIFGLDLALDDFLVHCSPTATNDTALLYNAAYADKRLDGKRSKRVEKLCSENNGRGTPIDFISIHTYNNSKTAAGKLIKAKETALRIDPEYYEKLWINNFESVPTWIDFDDPGASEWTFGNGYMPSWTADVVGRLLKKASDDHRYAYGETIYTIWGFTQENFQYLNDITMKITVGNKLVKRTEILPKPIFHFTNLLSTMGNNYYVLPQNQIDGHTVSGFATPSDDSIRLLLYSHHGTDTQSRSRKSFNIDLDLKGIEWDNVTVTQYQFDKDHNTFYPIAVKDRTKTLFSEKEFEELKELTTLKPTGESQHSADKNGNLNISLPLQGNGVNFVIIEKATGKAGINGQTQNIWFLTAIIAVVIILAALALIFANYRKKKTIR